jgi:hypothetical protein
VFSVRLTWWSYRVDLRAYAFADAQDLRVKIERIFDELPEVKEARRCLTFWNGYVTMRWKLLNSKASRCMVKRFSSFETRLHFAVGANSRVLGITGTSGIIGPGVCISGSVGADFFLVLHYVAQAGFMVSSVTIDASYLRECSFNEGNAAGRILILGGFVRGRRP